MLRLRSAKSVNRCGGWLKRSQSSLLGSIVWCEQVLKTNTPEIRTLSTANDLKNHTGLSSSGLFAWINSPGRWRDQTRCCSTSDSNILSRDVAILLSFNFCKNRISCLRKRLQKKSQLICSCIQGCLTCWRYVCRTVSSNLLSRWTH